MGIISHTPHKLFSGSPGGLSHIHSISVFQNCTLKKNISVRLFHSIRNTEAVIRHHQNG